MGDAHKAGVGGGMYAVFYNSCRSTTCGSHDKAMLAEHKKLYFCGSDKPWILVEDQEL
jgi:hypothetical protein